MKKIKNWIGRIKERFVPRQGFSLEEKTFLLVTISGILMSIVGLFGNISLGMSVVTMIISALNIVIDIICIAYFYRTGKWKIPSLIVILYAIFILFLSLWFSSGGATGSTMPFVVLIGIFVVIAFKGKFRAAILAIVIVMFTAFTLLEMAYPGIVTPYPSRDAHYTDLAIGMILSYAVSVFLAYQVLSDYQKSKLKTEQLVEQLEVSAITDSLTGIYNRRYLTTCVNDEMRKAYDNGSDLVLCIFDIDFFKKINDTYGHVFGDKVLVELAKCVGRALGEDEIFGRYGGEEFLIIFRNSTLAQALAKMNAVYDSIRKVEWGNDVRVTISSGLSVYCKGVSYSAFLENADVNLYKAKENGRNQIVY